MSVMSLPVEEFDTEKLAAEKQRGTTRTSTCVVTLRQVQKDGVSERDDEIATEEPLEIRLVVPPDENTAENAASKNISITMRTPGADLELALGFLYTEGILKDRSSLDQDWLNNPPTHGRCNVVEVFLAPGVSIDFDRLSRNVYTTSSCGICGKTSLEHVRTSIDSPPVCKRTFPKDFFYSLVSNLEAYQPLFARTGGIHASALFSADRKLLLVREDVGRHNAMDKLIGALFLAEKLPASDTVILVSGRASFELVQKAIVAGIPILAAVGAPTSLAVSLAEEFGLTLIGFLRDDRMNIYCGEERIEC